MKRYSALSFTLGIALSTAATVAACGGSGSSEDENGAGPTGEGGSSSVAGKSGAGHAGASGKSGAAGHAGGSAGTTATGGTSGSQGGKSGASGASGKGGASGSAGASGKGGAAGNNAVGGHGGTGGSPSTGGSSGSGTSLGGSSSAGTSASAGSGGSDQQQGFDVEPTQLQTITVPIGATTPFVAYTATLNGQPVSAGWSVDRGDLGKIAPGPASGSTFTPSGTTGGLVTILAGFNGQTVKRQVLIKLTGSQNGINMNSPGELLQNPGAVGDLKTGGGVGGVGGEGLGGAVTDPGILASLMQPGNDGTAQNLHLLYPYDRTVWLRGMLAPLLMWDWSTGNADAIEIKLSTTSGSFAWTGTFLAPPILGMTKGPFIRHPIPQDVWDIATNTAGGPTTDGSHDDLTMSVTLSSGGQGYGPITETWPVAPARLTGTVYYNSYGTQLVKNWGGNHDTAGNRIGAAILGVHAGDVGPKLIVGQNSNDDSGCRVCHVVSSRGRWLITQSEQGTPGDGRSFLYDLTAADIQGSAVQLAQEGVFTWAAMTSDGSYALTNSVDPSSTNPGILNGSSNNATSSFWQFGPSPTAASQTGLPSPVAAGYPAYSPDDSQVAYIDVTGQSSTVDGPLKVSTYDSASHTFGPAMTIATPAATQRIGYPVYLPDNDGVIFETEVRASQSDSVMVTRNGARSELWWSSLNGAPQPVPLNALNGKDVTGKSYLPTGIYNHGTSGAPDPQSSYDESMFDDTTLSYEPTVLPIVAGGYAWVVFTSRRLYGNQLTAVPWKSWPLSYDTGDLTQATVKKLWIAAIDLNAPPGSDPSHPAFYLPAQEILAGNSRGFWVLDPCNADGTTCQSGDQCCNGYCEPNGTDGALVCSNTPPNGTCSATQEKCASAADCCDQTETCVNGFCAQAKP